MSNTSASNTDPGQTPWPAQLKATVSNWDDTLKYVALVFATIELIPKRGALAPTVLAIVLVFLWLVNRRHREIRRLWRAGEDVIRKWPLWWQPAAALLILVIAWGAVVADKLHVTITRPNFLFAHNALEIEDKGYLHNNLPTSDSAAQPGARLTEKTNFHIWKTWMSQGVPSSSLSWVKSETFDDDYASFEAILTVDQDYVIHYPVAFLVYDAPRFGNDPNYRPVFRQMRVTERPGKHTISIDLERPGKGEYLEIFCQVQKKADGFVPITDLIIGNNFKVR